MLSYYRIKTWKELHKNKIIMLVTIIIIRMDKEIRCKIGREGKGSTKEIK